MTKIHMNVQKVYNFINSIGSTRFKLKVYLYSKESVAIIEELKEVLQHYTLSGHSYEFLFKDFMQQAIYLSITTNVTPQKRNGRNGVLKFFHRD